MWLEKPARSLWRISGFRLVLRSVLLSLAGALLVFGIVHHAAESGWRDQIDVRVAAAQTDILGDIQRNRETLTWNVQTTLAEGSGLLYAALAPDGRWLAGNFRLSPAVADGWRGPKTLDREPGLTLPRHVLAIRGTALRFPGGQRLFIAADASALLTLKSLIARSFLAVFGTILALGLVTGLWAARGTLRRVDQFAQALHEIIDGDLSRRVEISRTGDEFDRLAAEMNLMLQRIQELMENLRQVTNDISHDLRSPLGRLREHLELSRSRVTDSALETVFDEAIAQLDQALGIFTAMLRIAEVEAGARRAQFGPVNLSALLTLLAESYEPVLTESGITLTAEIADGLKVHGDRELLAQLFANLLDNIALHAQGAAKASICATAEVGWMHLKISDDGRGVPVEAQARVLQRFVRLDAARHRPGYGLGLPLARAIAALHGGQFAISGGEAGLTVLIKLPTAQ
jgi:signal transduction histidine kinase